VEGEGKDRQTLGLSTCHCHSHFALTFRLLGSGLAVQPNRSEKKKPAADAVFELADKATSEDRAQVRRTITMVRFLSEPVPLPSQFLT
jgi:hypothetical protein